MARLGGDNNVTNSLVILSSDDEDDEKNSTPKNNSKAKTNNVGDKQKSKEAASTSTSTSSIANANDLVKDREIPADFMWLMKTIRKYLESKDERKCNILGLMYKKASPALTTSRSFKSFVEDIMIEIGRGKNDRENILSLLTSVCQTLAVGEIMWDPPNRSNRSRYKHFNSKDLKPETKKQCEAVKKLLFQDDSASIPLSPGLYLDAFAKLTLYIVVFIFYRFRHYFIMNSFSTLFKAVTMV